MKHKRRSIARLALFMFVIMLGCVASSNAGQDVQVPVYFNHTYGVITQATVEAIQNNTYVNDNFIDVEVRTTVRPDITYTGTYLNARETYLELFSEGTLGMPLGTVGVALGDEVEDGIQAIQAMWQAAFGEDQVSTIDLVSHDVDGVDTPWFYAVDPLWSWDSDYTGFWAMEYVPNPGSTAPRTRLEERALRYDPAKLVQNILGVVYGLPDDDRANMKTTLAAVGWQVHSWGNSFLAISPVDNGSHRFIYVKPEQEDRLGLLGVVWQLNHYESRTEYLGDAVLRVGILGAPLAVLWIAPPDHLCQRAIIDATMAWAR